jgi:hypothetical protein
MLLQQFPFTGTRKLTVIISEFICNYNQMHIATFQIPRHCNWYRSGTHSLMSITGNSVKFRWAYFITCHADLYATSGNSPIVKLRRFHMNKNTSLYSDFHQCYRNGIFTNQAELFEYPDCHINFRHANGNLHKIKMAYLEIKTQMTFNTIPNLRTSYELQHF